MGGTVGHMLGQVGNFEKSFWSPSQTSGTTTTAPWGPAQPYLQQNLQNVQNLNNRGTWQAYPGQTVAGFNSQQQQAMGTGYTQALANLGQNSTLGQANQLAQNTLSGQYLNPNSNPYLQQYYNQGAQNLQNQYQQITQPALNAQGIAAGAYGGSRSGVAQGLAQQGMQQQLQNLATNIYGGAYGQERQNQQQAMLQAPSALQNAQYQNVNAALGIGGMGQNYQQQLLNAAQQQYYQNQQLPWQQASQYTQLLNSMAGQGGSVTQPYYGPSPLTTLLGAGATGAGIYSLLA